MWSVYVCLLSTLVVIAFLTLFGSVFSHPKHGDNRHDDLPEVRNLRTTQVTSDSFTVKWDKPRSTFDDYEVTVFSYNGRTSGSCHYGATLLEPGVTVLSCEGLGPCSIYDVTVATTSGRRPTRTSQGVTETITTRGKGKPRIHLASYSILT